MNIRDFEYFHLLTQLKSFTRVAEKLNVSQPTVTYSVKRLEKEFGKDLIIRDQAHHWVNITLAGKILDNHIKKILEELYVTKTEIHRLKREKIEIGLPPIIGNYYFPKLSSIFLEKNVHNDVNLISGGSQEMFKLLKNGRLTLSLIGSTEPIVDEHLNIELLTEKKFVIVVSNKHLLANRKSVKFSELKDMPFVMLNERFIHANALKKISKHNDFTPNIIYRSNDLNILKGMIKQQIGIGFLAEIAVNDTDELIKIPLEDELQPKFLISLVQSNPTIPSASQELISNCIRMMHLD